MAGRKCTICEHKEVNQIDSLITKPVSFRSIASKFGLSHPSVIRHTENHLQLNIAALVEQQRQGRAINVHEEFNEQLSFAKELREASRKWLTVNGLIDLDPRGTEVTVTYLDHTDHNSKGEPKLKKAQLQELLDRIDANNFEPEFTVVKTMDLRKFALDAINTADTCIDKFAKLDGSYTKEKDNPQAIEQFSKALISWVEAHKGTLTKEDIRTQVEKIAEKNNLPVDRLMAGVIQVEVTQ